MKNKKMIVLLILIIYVVLLFGSIGIIFSSDSGSTSKSSSSSRYNQKSTLESAYDKDKKGQTLTEREQRELDSYRKWEKKTYGDNI